MSDNGEAPVGPGRPASSGGRLARLIRKELLEILRDRRTITTLVLMPLLLYPLLTIAFKQFFLAYAAPEVHAPAYLLGFESEPDRQRFYGVLEPAGELPEREQAEFLSRVDLPPLELQLPEVGPEIVDRLRSGRVDLVVRPAAAADAPPADWEILYRKDSLRSLEALRHVERRLAAVNAALRRTPQGLRLIDGPPPARFRATPLPRAVRPTDLPLATLIPLILILMTITGAVYPAIDLTAGERERGTMEILVAAPVPRMGLLFAKYVSVWTVAVLTALVNLSMMVLTVEVSGMGQMLFGQGGLNPLQVVEIFGLLLLFAGFFSAVLLCITSTARSFKEAQAYLIPLMLVSLAPGIAGMIPGLKLTAAISLVPLLNIVLLGRDLLEQNPVAAGHVALVVLSTAAYAVAAVHLAARIFGAEDVLYNEQNSWGDLFRRPRVPQDAPSLSSAMLCLCLMFFLGFLAEGLLRGMVDIRLLDGVIRGGTDPGAFTDHPFGDLVREQLVRQQLTQVGLTVAVFAAVPLGAALLRRVRLAPGFGLRRPGLLAPASAALLGLSLWPLVLELGQVLFANGWTFLTPQRAQEVWAFQRFSQALLPPWLPVTGLALIGVVEEFFFRGFLFRALEKVCRPAAAVLASALLFGLFHLAVPHPLGVDRFIPSALMGLVLGWVRWQSGSVLPCMLLHATYNGMLAWVGYQYRSPGGAGLEIVHLPLPWIIGGAVGAVAGFGLIALGARLDAAESRARAGEGV